MPYPRRRAEEAPEPDLPALAAAMQGIGSRAGALLADAERIIEAARDGLPLPDGLDRRALALLAAGLRHSGGEAAACARELARIRGDRTYEAVREAMIRADERQQMAAALPRHRHRASRSRRPGKGQLELIPGGKGVRIAAAAASVAAAGVIGSAGYSDLARSVPLPAARHAAAAALPVLGADAVPYVTPQPQRYSYVPRHAKPSPAAAGATLAPSAPPSAPPPSPLPSVTPSAAPGGTLDVQTARCAIGASGTCLVTFTAVGGDVEWQASASDPALSLGEGEGTLASGESVTVTVTVQTGSLAGSGYVTVSDGDGNATQVPVTWVALPPAP